MPVTLELWHCITSASEPIGAPPSFGSSASSQTC